MFLCCTPFSFTITLKSAFKRFVKDTRQIPDAYILYIHTYITCTYLKYIFMYVGL